MRTIALTGRIGSGKSTVATVLASRGAGVIDADRVVHDLYRDDAGLRRALEDRFGASVMAPDGVNRAALGAIVFADPSARRDLEMLVHPRVHAQQDLFLQRSRALGLPAAVLDRLEGRGMSREEARRRMSSQGSVGAWIDQFVSASMRLGKSRPVLVIDNSSTIEQTSSQIERFA
ncbi:MAG: dephospho-CoA kinase [Proteobacteria bacterium]|nr:dephospho-CoA kinase [Pseudomonadota bacterium]